MQRSDSQINQAVLDEFKWDTRVEEAELRVKTVDGIVTLTGTVSNWATKVAAQEAAHRVAGVHDVANEIQVKLPDSSARSDTEIAKAIRRLLEWDVLLPESRIHSTVSAGWVTLSGDVDYHTQRIDAENTIHRLTGVRGVLNQIEVKHPKLAQNDVRKSIEQALERRAARDASRVGLEIEDGRVRLTGTVHTWSERAAVVSATRATPGVHAVEDRLLVEPFIN
jgi:osmotically-inducible protein OsmY